MQTYFFSFVKTPAAFGIGATAGERVTGVIVTRFLLS